MKLPPHPTHGLRDGAGPAPALVRGLRHALRPFVRLMLASGITWPLVSEMIKGLFVEVAGREFAIAGRPVSDSRISLISGVHRKDVRRLRGAPDADEDAMPDAVSLGGRVLTTWLSDRRFRGADGKPRPLARAPDGSRRAGFEDLVASHSTDIRPRVLLDEWLRLGIAHLDGTDRVVLNAEAFVPTKGLAEKLYFFSHNLHDHAAAATQNLLASRAPQLERSLVYEGLAEPAIRQLEAVAADKAMALLTDLNRQAIDHEERGADAGAPRHRLTCGIYFYSEPCKEPEA